MADCYHKDAIFSDPVFSQLRGGQIKAMWSMLCLQAIGLTINTVNISADDATGQVIWEAKYEFGKPPRPVHNRVTAKFEFQDGKIIRHIDYFDLWHWSRMALGPLGFVLGWHTKVQERIRQQARRNLEKFIAGTKSL